MPVHQPELFRTPTGQTGIAAYIFAMAGIVSKLRALEREFDSLKDVIQREMSPEMVSGVQVNENLRLNIPTAAFISALTLQDAERGLNALSRSRIIPDEPPFPGGKE